MTSVEPDRIATTRPSGGSVVLLVIAACIAALALTSPDFWDTAAYRRSQLSRAPWRVLTGHWVHLGLQHALLNVAALGLLAALVGRALRPFHWMFLWLIASIAISAGLWWFIPELERYVGASGVLHAVAAAGAIALIPQQRLEGLLLLGGVIAKVCWEQLAGASRATAELIGGTVITEAHLIGTLVGIGYGIVAWWLRDRAKL